MYQGNASKVMTGEVRLSYCNLIKPRAPQQGGKEKYSVTILIPKSDTNTMADIQQSIAAAVENGVAKTWNGQRPPQPKTPIWDGDGKRQSGEPFGPECRGCWVLTASSEQAPGIVHVSNPTSPLSPTDIYSGMYARVSVNFFPYSNSGNRGVGAGLGNVFKTREGEPLDGRASAESEYKDIADEYKAARAFDGLSGPIPDYGYVQQPQWNMPPPAYQVPAINPITGQPL